MHRTPSPLPGKGTSQVEIVHCGELKGPIAYAEGEKHIDPKTGKETIKETYRSKTFDIGNRKTIELPDGKKIEGFRVKKPDGTSVYIGLKQSKASWRNLGTEEWIVTYYGDLSNAIFKPTNGAITSFVKDGQRYNVQKLIFNSAFGHTFHGSFEFENSKKHRGALITRAGRWDTLQLAPAQRGKDRRLGELRQIRYDLQELLVLAHMDPQDVQANLPPDADPTNPLDPNYFVARSQAQKPAGQESKALLPGALLADMAIYGKNEDIQTIIAELQKITGEAGKDGKKTDGTMLESAKKLLQAKIEAYQAEGSLQQASTELEHLQDPAKHPVPDPIKINEAQVAVQKATANHAAADAKAKAADQKLSAQLDAIEGLVDQAADTIARLSSKTHRYIQISSTLIGVLSDPKLSLTPHEVSTFESDLEIELQSALDNEDARLIDTKNNQQIVKNAIFTWAKMRKEGKVTPPFEELLINEWRTAEAQNKVNKLRNRLMGDDSYTSAHHLAARR